MDKDTYYEMISDNDFQTLNKLLERKEISLWNIITKLKKDENSYSDFLSFFLNPIEVHGLDDRFFKLFLMKIMLNERENVGQNRIKLHLLDIEMKDFSNVIIKREYDLREYGRVDIVAIDKLNKIVVLIENKLYSREGKEQTNRYYTAQKEVFKIDEYPIENRFLVFLSPDGMSAGNENFISVSYQIIIDVVYELLDNKYISSKIQNILIDYVDNLKEIIVDSEKIDLAEQIFSRYATVIDFLYKVGHDELGIVDQDWNGIDYYYNIGENEHRNWDDYIKYSFIAAGGGKKYSDPLKRLNEGDRIFAYYKSKGYLGVAIVKEKAVPLQEFKKYLTNKSIDIETFEEPGIAHDIDDLEKCEWIVRVEWEKYIVDRDKAIFFTGIFANQNIVCRLTNKQTKTVQIIKEKLGIKE